jgi:multiple sugar transport system permease protein
MSTGEARRTLIGLCWVSPWLAGFLAFLMLPIGLSVWYSLTDYPLREPPLWVGADNYRRLLHDDVFWRTIVNTLVYAAFSIPLGTALALWIATLLNRRGRLAMLIRAAVYLPTLSPIVATAMIWLWMFNAEHGLINGLLGLVGIRGPNWLKEPTWAMGALVIMSLWSVGQAAIVYLAALRGVPSSLYEAAEMDGVGRAGRFVHVTLPTISPVILFNVIVAIIVCWQVFAVPYIMTQGGPGRSTYFYTMYLYDSAFVYGQMGYASALAWIQTLIILFLTALTFMVSRRHVWYRVS